jgi:amidase
MEHEVDTVTAEPHNLELVHPFAPLTLATIRTLGEQSDLIAKLQRYTCPFDMTGNPTITLPGGFSEAGLPIAIQLAAAHLDEAMLVRAGAAFQGVTSWQRRRPPLSSGGCRERQSSTR